jgi:hypothetical protein
MAKPKEPVNVAPEADAASQSRTDLESRHRPESVGIEHPRRHRGHLLEPSPAKAPEQPVDAGGVPAVAGDEQEPLAAVLGRLGGGSGHVLR